jgi:hypothetical protein
MVATSFCIEAPARGRRRHLSISERETSGLISSRVTASGSYGGSSRREHRLQAMGRVRAVCDEIAFLPLLGRLLSDLKVLGRTLAGSLLAAISERTAAWRAVLCTAVNMASLPGSIARTPSTVRMNRAMKSG